MHRRLPTSRLTAGDLDALYHGEYVSTVAAKNVEVSLGDLDGAFSGAIYSEDPQVQSESKKLAPAEVDRSYEAFDAPLAGSTNGHH